MTGSSSISKKESFSLHPHLFELKNGLRVLVVPDSSAPVVSLQYWVGTGSIHEGEWLGSGISHFLEHLMFKGTEKRGNSEMAQEIQSLGGHLNAYTSFDHTVYYVDLPSDHWKAAGEILGDAVFKSTLPEEEFEREQEVIRREIAMVEDNPDRRMGRLLFKTTFQKHPYRYPVIGLLPLFNQLRREDLLRYYHSRYVTQNVTLILVGDVNPSDVRVWAEDYLEKIPAKLLKEAWIPEETPQIFPREFQESFPTDLLRLALVFPIPGIEHEDAPALDLLSIMMGGTRSSRLHQKIVEEKGLAEEISAYAYTPSQYGLWGVSTRGQMEKAEELEKVLREELYQFKANTFQESDLDRARRQILLHHYRGMKSMSGKAHEIGSGWLLARDPHFQDRYLQRLRAVTLEEIFKVAQKYLLPSVENRIAIVPQNKAPQEGTSIAPQAMTQAVQKQKLKNGHPLLKVFNPHLPLTTFRTVFPGGLLADPQGKSGLSHLATQLLVKGTRKRTASQLMEKIEGLGGVLSADSHINSATLSIEILSSDEKEGFDLFQEILNEPMLREEELETERRKQLSSIQMDLDQPMSVARNMVREVLFSDHPYRNTSLGKAEEVKQITAEDVQQFWKSNLYAKETLYCLSSSVELDPVIARYSETFQANPTHSNRQSLIPFPLQQSFRVERTTPKQQAVLHFAFPTIGVTDPDQLGLEVLNEALSDLGSRLFIRIREKLGLAYFVGTSQFQAEKAGYFVFYVGTDPKKRDLVEKEMLEEIHQVATHGITSVEIERARAKLLSHLKMMTQDPASMVYSAAVHDYLGLGYDYGVVREKRFTEISCDEVNEVARKYLSNPNFVTAIVSPQ